MYMYITKSNGGQNLAKGRGVGSIIPNGYIHVYIYIFNTTVWINRPMALNESLTCVYVHVYMYMYI